jgi:hypothetical protein
MKSYWCLRTTESELTWSATVTRFLDSTRFHNYPDSKGLGLYLVKSQVESMGGSIRVESRSRQRHYIYNNIQTNTIMLDLILCVDDDPITDALQNGDF